MMFKVIKPDGATVSAALGAVCPGPAQTDCPAPEPWGQSQLHLPYLVMMSVPLKHIEMTIRYQ